MTKRNEEFERRRQAIEWHQRGLGFAKICRRLSRSKGWLSKWLRRFAADGHAGLHDHSRRPRRIRSATPAHVVARILALRVELERHRTRRTRYRGVGALEIQELLRLERRRVPSLSTIGRLLRRHHVPRQRARREGGSPPYPTPRVTQPGDLQQTDLVGPRYLRGPHGVTRFYSIHTIAIVGRGTWASQVRYKTADALCEHFVRAWAWLGLPRVSQIDQEMAATGGQRYPFTLSLVARLHLLGGVHLIYLPPGEPGRNALVESFNDLWQERVLVHPCPDLRAVRRESAGFHRFYHERRVHRALTGRRDGARFPGPWLRVHADDLRWWSAPFSLDAYRTRRGALALPVARGSVSWVQKVAADGTIDVNGRGYFVGKRATGHYVRATLMTHRRHLVIYSATHRRLKRFRFPLVGPIVSPLLPGLR